MHTIISGQHFSIGDSLKEYIESALDEASSKYCRHSPSAEVHLTKEEHNNSYECKIIVKDGSGQHHVFKGESSSDDVYTSFEEALSKVVVQLSKQKSKDTDHHQKSNSKEYNQFDE